MKNFLLIGFGLATLQASPAFAQSYSKDFTSKVRNLALDCVRAYQVGPENYNTTETVCIAARTEIKTLKASRYSLTSVDESLYYLYASLITLPLFQIEVQKGYVTPAVCGYGTDISNWSRKIHFKKDTEYYKIILNLANFIDAKVLISCTK